MGAFGAQRSWLLTLEENVVETETENHSDSFSFFFPGIIYMEVRFGNLFLGL